jgi:hypothetical protein
VDREIAGELILVPIRNNVGELESIYTLNDTAAFIWALLDGEHTLAEIRDAIVTKFDVEAGKVEADLVELIEQLESVPAVQLVG